MGKYGTRCEYGDCFACNTEKEMCLILRPTYEEDEVCPFYKYGIDVDLETKADEETIEYANKRIKKLKEDTKALNSKIRKINSEKDEIQKKIREAQNQKENAEIRMKERTKNN